jgi:hypothetical protein
MKLTRLWEEDAAGLVVQRMDFHQKIQRKKMQSLAPYTHRMPPNLATL